MHCLEALSQYAYLAIRYTTANPVCSAVFNCPVDAAMNCHDLQYGCMGAFVCKCVTNLSIMLTQAASAHPVLSLRRVDMRSSTVPSASTTSNPSTLPCMDPYLRYLNPPAGADIIEQSFIYGVYGLKQLLGWRERKLGIISKVALRYFLHQSSMQPDCLVFMSLLHTHFK